MKGVNVTGGTPCVTSGDPGTHRASQRDPVLTQTTEIRYSSYGPHMILTRDPNRLSRTPRPSPFEKAVSTRWYLFFSPAEQV